MEEKLQKIRGNYLAKVNLAGSLKELDGLFLAIFGKNGEITQATKKFPQLSKDELKVVAPLLAQVKTELEQAIDAKRVQIREEGYQKLSEEKLDLTLTNLSPKKGYLHINTQFEQETVDLFSKLGFQRYEAPQIDSDEFNFSLLNIPQNHPARDLWDTLYIDSERFGINPGKLLLRTHTSNSQVRIMREFELPLRMMVLGRCFRYENLDARHEHTFEQFEIVYVDKGVSMANLQYLSEYFLKGIFGKEMKARMRPKYYPFVEPGVGVDGLCIFCKGKGCKVCGGSGWLEIAGAGMIHPTVLKNGGIDPNIYSGIAWGFGLSRILMLKYGIADIRTFLSGDLKQLLPKEKNI
ncbi:MAG: phenylalanine--tRNA ligase subunit alpha [Patescibacteria group bacterium]|nr:phenylalanine--tRNA ligase subunit alpha [Patescibacteria group bacterium]